MSIGKYTYGTPNIMFPEKASLTIGSFCSIAGGLNVFLGGNHRCDWVTTYPFGHINTHVFNTFSGIEHPATKGDVVIGNDVWIGANVTIMSGVTIADGAVIAANSHVVKNIEPYTINGENPCRMIKKRFTDEQISHLLQIQWWKWDDQKINQELPLLCSGNIDDFINKNKLPSNII